jgi:hypothetical protein
VASNDLSYNSAMLKIHCSGLTITEIKELRALLKTLNGVADVQYQPDYSGNQNRSPTMGLVTPVFWVSISVVAPALKVTGTIAGTALLEKASDNVYKVAKEWLNYKWTGKKLRGVKVGLYGPDGTLIETVEK